MYMISTANSKYVADGLPDMTVTNFINAVEKFFNVKFQVDSKDKSISIIPFSKSIENKRVVKIYPINGYTANQDSTYQTDLISIAYHIIFLIVITLHIKEYLTITLVGVKL